MTVRYEIGVGAIQRLEEQSDLLIQANQPPPSRASRTEEPATSSFHCSAQTGHSRRSQITCVEGGNGDRNLNTCLV